jgi:hypothetical protein
VIGFLRAMKLQLHPKIPIRINVVAPGWTETGITAGVVKEFKRVGVVIQPPVAIGVAVAKLVTNPSYHGHTFFVASNQYAEFEGPLTEETDRLFGPMNGDEKQLQELLTKLKADRDQKGQKQAISVQ